MQQQLQEPSATSSPVLRSPEAPGISSKGGHQGFLEAVAAALAGNSQGLQDQQQHAHVAAVQQHAQVAAVQQHAPGLPAHGSPSLAAVFQTQQAAASAPLDDAVGDGARGDSAGSFLGSGSETFEQAADEDMFDQPNDSDFFAGHDYFCRASSRATTTTLLQQGENCTGPEQFFPLASCNFCTTITSRW
jgi:hypothetical protein